MLDPAATALIDSAKSLQMATIDPDGVPHLSTLWFGWLDGAVVAWTGRDSHKARNIRRDPRVACLVELGSEYSEIRGVSLRGTVELIDDADSLHEIAAAIFVRNFPADEQPDLDALVGARRRVGLTFAFDRVAWWDSRGSGRRLPQP